MENLSGTNIKGYELRERLGAGGFGAVYKAHQTTVGREVAIKIILPHFANHPDFIRRFETEAQLVARLEHLHIIPLYDYWRDPDGAYLVMRWLKGGSLREALANGAFNLESSARMLDQITSALSAAHRSSVIHRDLKPGNILLDEEGNAYLADFGIAKDNSVKSGITDFDAIVGSPDYLAPEQARSEPVTPRTDIYSLGVVLYEMLTGEHPFPNLTAVERLFKHLNDPIPEITNLPPDTSSAINAIIQKATAKNPQQRYADALEMAAAFRQAARTGETSNVVETLTQREQEILQLLIDGLSNKEIAQRLFITVLTVKWYTKQIYRKLNVRSRVQAIVRARELNLIGNGNSSEIQSGPLVSFTPIPTEDFKPDNPYKGLRAFQSADHQDFFGREKLVQKLVRRLNETGEGMRFLGVVGPSGSGKSSLVKAGLIPALWRGEVPGSEKWFVVEMLPSAYPLDELEVALTRVAANPAASLREHLERDERGLLRAAGLILPNDGSELVLVIDQFEEVFTMVEDEAHRLHFLNLLHAAATDSRSRIRIIITLRADYYDRPLHYQEFGDLLRNRMETVLPLSADELERAIARPAERVGAMFEEGLIASIIAEVNYQPAALPLLQYALTELFEQRKGRMLTREAYELLGRAVGALAKRADELYLGLDTTGQEVAHQMFLRLVTLGEGAEDTRRRAARAELLAATTDADIADEILDTYAEYRLLTLDHDPASRTPTVELAHEALIREWERLKAWLNESRSEIRLQRQLSSAAQEWHTARQDPSFLLRGSRLEVFEKWAADTTLTQTPLEKRYLQASLTARTHEQVEESARQAREIKLENRSRGFLRGIIGVLLLATVAGFALSAFALNQRDLANRNAAVSQSLALASAAQSRLTDGSTDHAVALSLAANRIDNPPALAQRMLYESAVAPGTIRRIPCITAWCWGVDVSPDESTILTGDLTGKIVLSDIHTGQPLHTYEGGNTDEIQGIAFLPDGQRFLSTGIDDRMVLWDIASGEVIRKYESPAGDLMGIDISPDGRLAVTAAQGGTPIIWDIETGEILHQLVGHDTSLQVLPVAFSPDGKTVLSGSEDTTLILWDAQTGEILQRFEGHTNIVFYAEFSPDGRSAVSTSFDNSLILWDIATGQIIRRFVGHTNWVFGAAFSQDGMYVLSSSRDGTIILWDVATSEQLHTYVAQEGFVLSVMWLDHDTQFISSHNTGYVRIWQRSSQDMIRSINEQEEMANSEPDDTLNSDGDVIAYSINGQWAAASGSGSDADEIFLWDVETGALNQRFTGHTGNVTSISFSPDQNHMVSAGWDHVVILWDVQTGEPLKRFTGHSAAVFDVEFSPDGTQIVSASEDRTIILWDIETGQQARHFDGFTDAVNTVNFSPDGRLLLAGLGTIRYAAGNNEDNSLRIFDVVSGAETGQLGGHTAPVTTALFSRDGHTILSGSMDATVRLWDVSTGEEIRRFTGQTAAIWSIDYSPNGQYIAAGSQDGTTMVWDSTSSDMLRQFRRSTSMVYGVKFSVNNETLLTTDSHGKLNIWRLSLDLPLLLSWTLENRYVHDLPCSEQVLYQLSQSCSEVNSAQ